MSIPSLLMSIMMLFTGSIVPVPNQQTPALIPLRPGAVPSDALAVSGNTAATPVDPPVETAPEPQAVTGGQSGKAIIRLAPIAEVPAASEPERRLQLYINELSKGFDTKVRNVLPYINGTSRKLLALKYYLRRGQQDFKGKWTWTPKEIARYKKSSEYRQAMAEVEKVKMKFAELNPGYTLGVNTEVRTLEDQIVNWNGTGSIQAAANALAATALKTVSDTTLYQGEIDRTSIQKFRRFLESYKVTAVPTVAVPGFSQHGQLRAFDFVIKQGNTIIAGTSTGSVRGAWDQAGWTVKLKEAITQASGRFSGPLASPREPWHYTYMR